MSVDPLLWFNPSAPRRRPQTSYSEYQSFAASPRIKSARYPSVTMPRSHVSIARFYDWSEDLGECVSISKFYRDLANTQKYDRVRGKARQFSFNGAQPGRMFLRDKAGLTKGEREIIEGICKNRGDVQREETYPKDEWEFVRSHRDAWNVRKQILNHRSVPRSDSPPVLKLPEELFSRVQVNELHSPKDHCVFCDSNTREVSLRICAHKREEAPKAPPTTPDRASLSDDEEANSPRVRLRSKYSKENTQSTQESPRLKVLRRSDSSANQFQLTRNVDQFELARDRKKVFVNVFLPKISGETSRDHTNMSMAVDSRRNPLLEDKVNLKDGMRFSGAFKNENSLSTSIQKIPNRVNSER